MKKIFVLLLSGIIFLCTACTKPQDESPSKFQRQANIRKYLKKSQASQRLNQEREKPLPVETLLDVSRLTNQTQMPDTEFIREFFIRNRRSLDKRLLEAYITASSEHIAQLMEKHKLQAMQATQQARSPWDLAARLGALLPQQDQDIQQFMAEQTAQTRLKPAKESLVSAEQRLLRRCNEFLERIRFYYGDEAAKRCRPILQETASAYVAAMLQADTNEELDQRLNTIVQQTQTHIQEITASSGDPLGVTPEELIVSLHSDMILSYQNLENYIERLYGKNAVLQAREVFNHFMKEGEDILRENARLSNKKQNFSHLNAHYRNSLLDLQRQWNAEWVALGALPA